MEPIAVQASETEGAPREPLSRRRMAFADGTVSFLSGGTEGPVVVFAHGAGLNALAYRGALARMARSARVLAPDLRGHGASSLPTDTEELPDWRPYAQDLISFIDAAVAPTDRPLVLAGHLMGATVSLLAAGARPDFVRGLVLFEPVLFPPVVLTLIRLAQRFDLIHRLSFFEAAPRRRALWPSREPLIAALRDSAQFGAWPDEALGSFVEGGVVTRDDGALEFACDPVWEAQTYDVQAHDLWALLDRVRCPIHIVRAATGSKTMRAAAWLLQMSTPETRIEVVPGATPALPLIRPELAAEIVLAMTATGEGERVRRSA